MRATEFLSEGIINWVSRKLGRAWGKPGDVVHGNVVADYLENSTYHTESKLKKIRKSKFQLTNLDLATAEKYRHFTNSQNHGSVIDIDKLDNARQMKITYDSLIKYPPVLAHDGFIWDGNHRLERAIELQLPSIPVLLQVSMDKRSSI
jgi:hypothetical protein